MSKFWCTSIGVGMGLLAACQSPSEPASVPAGAAAQVSLLTRYNLAPLLQHFQQRERDTLGYAYQGFLGPTHRRVELVFTEVRRNPVQLAAYAVRGKSRYQGVVTPFEGTITFAQVVEQPRYVPRSVVRLGRGKHLYPSTGATCNDCAMYTAVGQFEWREATTTHHGTCHGRIALDWQVQPPRELRMEYRTDSTLTRGGGIRLDGQWQPSDREPTQTVTWVRDIEGFANNGAAPLPELIQNGSNPRYNPRYARLGWTGYLYNRDYWWEK